MKSIKIMRMTK